MTAVTYNGAREGRSSFDKVGGIGQGRYSYIEGKIDRDLGTDRDSGKSAWRLHLNLGAEAYLRLVGRAEGQSISQSGRRSVSSSGGQSVSQC